MNEKRKEKDHGKIKEEGDGERKRAEEDKVRETKWITIRKK